MNDDERIRTSPESIAEAYDKAEQLFLHFFSKPYEGTVEHNLLMNLTVNFVEKLGFISPRSEKIIIFPNQPKNSESKELVISNELVLEYLNETAGVVQNRPDIATAIENAKNYFGNLSENY